VELPIRIARSAGGGGPRTRAAFALCLAAWALSSTGGCSFLFVSGPRAGEVRARALTCTTSNGWPIVDTLLASYQLVRTGFALSRSDADYRGMPLSRDGDIALGASLLALTAISAAVGFNDVSNCHDAHASLDDAPPPPRLRSPSVSPARALPGPPPSSAPVPPAAAPSAPVPPAVGPPAPAPPIAPAAPAPPEALAPRGRRPLAALSGSSCADSSRGSRSRRSGA
jgi:hypothetical protein